MTSADLTVANSTSNERADAIGALKAAATAFLASRLALLLVGWLALTLLDSEHPGLHGTSATWKQLFNLVYRFDAGWYWLIAKLGYSTGSPAVQPHAIDLAFWPAFPYLARFLAAATGMPILGAGGIIANLAFFLCLYLLYRYCVLVGLEKNLATLAVFLMALVPESFLFSAFYADALGTLGMLGAMIFARRERWWSAGLFAILASSSRPTGVAVIVFLVAHAYQTLGWRGFLQPWRDARPFVPVVLVPAGYFLMLWISFRVSGDAFAEVHTRSAGWYVNFAPPLRSLVNDFRHGADLKFWTLGALGLATSIVPLLRAKLMPDAIFAIGYFVLIFSQNNPAGLIHYSAGLPVIYVGFALMCKGSDSKRYALLGTFATVNAVLFTAWALVSPISI